MNKEICPSMYPYTITKSTRREYMVNLETHLFTYRIIFVNGEVNIQMAYDIIQQIQYLAMCDPNREIYMMINSPGGCVLSGLAIVDCMNSVKCPIVTIGIGMIASMGTVLLCAGTKGRRSAYPFARIMAHQLSSRVEGEISNIGMEIKECEALRRALYKIIAKRTKLATEENVTKFCRYGDLWMSADEALRIGFIDSIIVPEKKEDCYKYNSANYSFASKEFNFLLKECLGEQI